MRCIGRELASIAAQDRLEDAISDCDRVLAEAPSHIMALYNRGLIALERGDFDRATKCLEVVLDGDHERLDPYIPLAGRTC